MNKVEKRKHGRPTKYKPEYDKQAYELSLLGLTDIEMARVFGVTEKTLHNWTDEHPSFLQSRIDGKEIADGKVTQSLFKRAMGYEHSASKIFNDGGSPMVVEYTEKYPPDTTACIFWLKNRQRDKWRDRVDNTLSNPDGGPVEQKITAELPGLGDALLSIISKRK